jgi:hypothetical protein
MPRQPHVSAGSPVRTPRPAPASPSARPSPIARTPWREQSTWSGIGQAALAALLAASQAQAPWWILALAAVGTACSTLAKIALPDTALPALAGEADGEVGESATADPRP